MRRGGVSWSALGSALAIALLTQCTLRAAVVRLDSPAQMSPPLTTLDFEGRPHLTAANDLYVAQGVRYSRDDGAQTAVYDPDAFEARSGLNILATPGWAGAPPGWTMHRNAHCASRVREVGAFFGNDRGPAAFDSLTLSAFGVSGELLGSVSVTSNRNGNADQFIGLRSDTPFVRARFEHSARDYGVGIDDFSFGAVPEPGGVAVAGCVALSLLARPRR